MNWRKLVVLAFLMGGAACHRKVSAIAPSAPPPTPPPAVAAEPVLPAAFRDGEAAFESGDFARAANSYESFLQSSPNAQNNDRIWFRLGVARSMSGVAALEAASSDAFTELIRDFPQSDYVPPARMILSLRADIVRLQADTAQLQADQKVQEDRIGQLTDDLNSRQADIGRLQSETARLQADQKTRDEKIKQLNDDLDKLKKIDLDRRRTP